MGLKLRHLPLHHDKVMSAMLFQIAPFIKSMTDMTFPHHYQGRIDFNTVNPFHSTRMDLVSIPAWREVMANPVPRDKIFQYSPCRGLSTHPRAMNMQLTVQC